MISESLTKDIQDCARLRYPEEMVGCVVGGNFVELKNVAPHPCERYILSAKDKVMLFEMEDSLIALVHSHPKMDNMPSELDFLAAKTCQFPFWIVGTDGVDCTEVREVLSGQT
jgi:proteasome lid subunit RPN8/RPN11